MNNTKNCVVCGKEFRPRRYMMDKAKYCSYDCHRESQFKHYPWEAQAAELYRSGLGVKAIAKMLGVIVSQVRSVAIRHGVYDSRRTLGVGGVPHNKGRYNASEARIRRLIMDGYRIEDRFLLRFDEIHHWKHHKQVAVWNATRSWRKLPEEVRRAKSRKLYEKRRADGPLFREKANIIRKRWIKKNPGNRMRMNLSTRLYLAMQRNGATKCNSVTKYIGCSVEHLKRYLESQFVGHMSWDNYGRSWHVDHIIPCVEFDHNDEAQIKQCWNWLNLRPMWKRQNLIKNAKVTEPQQQFVLTI